MLQSNSSIWLVSLRDVKPWAFWLQKSDPCCPSLSVMNNSSLVMSPFVCKVVKWASSCKNFPSPGGRWSKLELCCVILWINGNPLSFLPCGNILLESLSEMSIVSGSTAFTALLFSDQSLTVVEWPFWRILVPLELYPLGIVPLVWKLWMARPRPARMLPPKFVIDIPAGLPPSSSILFLLSIKMLTFGFLLDFFRGWLG